MFQPYYIKSEYLKRVIYSGVLIAGGIIGVSISSLNPESGIGLGLTIIAFLLLAFLCMRLLSDLIAKLTGLTFFLSFAGMGMLFLLSAALSVILGPLYFGFNLLQYFRASET